MWNAVPDSVTFIGIGVVVFLLAWLLRTMSAEADRQHAAVVERTAALARERERIRQANTLSRRLLTELTVLAEGEAVTDLVIRERLRTEVRWLEVLITKGLPEESTDLVTALREVAAEGSALGVSVTMRLPPVDPGVPGPAAAALAGATREAVTNAREHSGTTSVEIELTVGSGAARVRVRDTGRGFDPSTPSAGTGLQRSIRERLEQVGGGIRIRSSPATGTEVSMWVPLAGDTEVVP